MDSGGLKNIAIIILLLVNLALGGILLWDRVSEADAQSKSWEELTLVLQGLGISLEEGVLPSDETVYRCAVSRDLDSDALLTDALLGAAQMEDQGGNIHYYENENGWARYRSSGSFEITLLSAAGALEERMADGGLSVLREGSEYICDFDGLPVFNCRFSLSAAPSGGVRISGRRLPGTPQPGEAGEALNAETVLLRFLDEISASGAVFRSIRQIRQGYVLNSTVSGGELLPVWQISTDGGVWYMDAIRGGLISGIS